MPGAPAGWTMIELPRALDDTETPLSPQLDRMVRDHWGAIQRAVAQRSACAGAWWAATETLPPGEPPVGESGGREASSLSPTRH